MTISPVERKARARLPMLRLMQTLIPLPTARWLIERGLARERLNPGITREEVDADGVTCHWVIPENFLAEPVLLYLHGGGFVFGLTPQHLRMGAVLAQKLGFRVLMVDYRLAPEHPFPAALEDCLKVYGWLLEQKFAARNTVVAGDSAGGNLTLAMMLKLRDSGRALPAAAACLSPASDLTGKSRQRSEFVDPLLPSRAVQFYTRSYLGNRDARDPLISPMYGNLQGLPPLLVHVGGDEILREDAVRLVDKAASAGVYVRLEIFPRMWHVWQINLELPQAAQSLDGVADFFKTNLD